MFVLEKFCFEVFRLNRAQMGPMWGFSDFMEYKHSGLFWFSVSSHNEIKI